MKSNFKKNIAIVARGLNKGGVRRYVFNLLRQFRNYSDEYNFFLIYNQKNLFENKFDYAQKIYISGKNKLIWDYIKLPIFLKKYKLYAILYPKNIIPITHMVLPAKKINVIHDLGYFEQDLNAYKTFDTIYMKAFMKLSCKIADKTITVSDFTKKDIIKRLRVNPKKITTVPEAVEENFTKITEKEKLNKVIRKYNLTSPFIFNCGSLSPRKNIKRVLLAFNEVKDMIPHNLYLTGIKNLESTEIKSLINKNLQKRVRILGYVSEKELVYLYNIADLFIYASLYEGFGLPILEAQACGCPVLTSTVTSCPEVTGDSAHLVNPYSIDEIKDGMLNILKDNKYKKNLIKRGFKNIKRFSWEETSNEILKICEKV